MITDSHGSWELAILAWGDFNGDGFEDLAISVYSAARRGTYRSTAYYLLTRCRPIGVLLTVRSPQEVRSGDARCP